MHLFYIVHNVYCYFADVGPFAYENPSLFPKHLVTIEIPTHTIKAITMIRITNSLFIAIIYLVLTSHLFIQAYTIVMTQWKNYPCVGKSIQFPKCNLTSEQVRFSRQMEGYLSMETNRTRYVNTSKDNRTGRVARRAKKERCKTVPFSDILGMRKARAAYDPRSFTHPYTSRY